LEKAAKKVISKTTRKFEVGHQTATVMEEMKMRLSSGIRPPTTSARPAMEINI